MAYTKQTWADLPSKTTPINASRLGHIEDGIYDAAATADTAASNASSAISGLANKVDKVEGKGLSTNDYDDTAKGIVDAVTTNLSTKVNKSDVARIEDGTSPSATINADEQFYHNNILYTATADIATTDTITPNTNCRVSDSVTSQIASGVESAYQLVEDTVGWSGKNLAVPYTYNNTGSAAHGVTYVYDGTGKCTLNGTATAGDARPTLSQVTAKRYFTIHAGSYKPIADSDDVTVQVYDVDTSTKLSDGEIFTVNADTNVLVRLYQTNGKVYNNLIVSYMLLRADIIDDTFEPYHASVEESKCDNSVIAPVENGTTASQAYVVNDVFIRNGALCKVTSAISQGDTLSNQFTETNVGAILTALLNA